MFHALFMGRAGAGSFRQMLRFDGKVVVVTGAGGGLGRDYALTFAERGAAVVVNDLGGSAFGEGKGTSMADRVVDEIRSKGGKAVANYDSVEDGPKIIKTAVDNFGRVDLIHRVHLKGAYSVTKAAWSHMRQQKFGRIVVTSSNAGVYGNFGQANYSAAKLGLVGLSNALALEGAKYGIQCNALIPTAGSRLTQTVMPPELVDALKPEFVTPLTVWLCHESCPETGGVFEAAAGWFGKLHWTRSDGKVLRQKEAPATPELVRDHWQEITDMSTAKHYASTQEVTTQLVSVLQNIDDGSQRTKAHSRPGTGSENKMNSDLCRGFQLPAVTCNYAARDVIIYALGVGASVTDTSELKFLYEGHDNFCPLPTFAVIPAFAGNTGLGSGQVPGLKFDLSKVLHGEQYLEIYKPFPTDGQITVRTKIADLLDKGKGALVLTDADMFDQSGTKLATAQFATYLVGEGGFGGPRSSKAERATKTPPSRAPDAVVQQKTSLDQAALYRQSGDLNPLHIDSNFAALLGFKQPILHGLCTLAFSVRHVLKQYANNDVSKFKAVKVRFNKPVLPGQTLVTEMWREGNTILFQTKVAETGQIATTGGYVELKSVDGGSSTPQKGSGSQKLKSTTVFDELRKRLHDQPDMAKKVQAVFLWIITNNGAEAARYTVDLKKGQGEIYEGDPKGDAAGVTLTLSDDDMVSLVMGKLNPQQAFMSGKLKIKGNIMLTQKLQTLLKDQAKL